MFIFHLDIPVGLIDKGQDVVKNSKIGKLENKT